MEFTTKEVALAYKEMLEEEGFEVACSGKGVRNGIESMIYSIQD
jgi:hypothetical protein